MVTLPDFKTEKERQLYIAKKASYFTVVNRVATLRYEYPDFKTALLVAQLLANRDKVPFLIYAVLGPYNTYVHAAHPVRQNVDKHPASHVPPSA